MLNKSKLKEKGPILFLLPCVQDVADHGLTLVVLEGSAVLPFLDHGPKDSSKFRIRRRYVHGIKDARWGKQ